jgi:hypothetical protein
MGLSADEFRTKLRYGEELKDKERKKAKRKQMIKEAEEKKRK